MQLKWYPYELPFKAPLHTAAGVIAARKGLILEFGSVDVDRSMGAFGLSNRARPKAPDQLDDGSLRTNNRLDTHTPAVLVGDAAPLPGFSSESLDDIIEWLQSNDQKLEMWLSDSMDKVQQADAVVDEGDTPYAGTVVRDWYREHGTESPVPDALPSLQFAAHSMLLSGLLRKLTKGRRVQKIPGVPVNALVQAGTPKAELEAIWQQGIRTLKLKIGMNLAEEKRWLQCIAAAFSGFRLRLDANGAFSVSKAMEVLQWLNQFEQIEYIEQPVSSDELFGHGSELRRVGPPIAADESLRTSNDAQRLISDKSCDVLILKPMFVGGLHHIAEICEMARDSGIKVVFTTSLESGVGRNATAQTAACFGDRNLAHGLNTGSLLQSDVHQDAAQLRNGIYYPQI